MGMHLLDFLKNENLSQYDFADLIGVSQPAVGRYVNGERIPEGPIMKRIFDKTKGKVTANDFYGLMKKRK